MRKADEDRAATPAASEVAGGGGLPREEYIEQAYFFRRLLDRFPSHEPIQELMAAIQQEVLSTTKLPMAIDFMLGELKHSGGFAQAMSRLRHYFTPFQTFLMREAEDDRGRFDMQIAFAILSKEAEYRAEKATPQGEFLFQFESICRNRLSYDRGLAAMAEDPIYDAGWRNWILIVRRQVGLVDLADMIFVRSGHYRPRRRDLQVDDPLLLQPLFGEKEGQIAQANRRKDPLVLFASLQRHLGYPAVPRQERARETVDLLPQLARRVERMEARLKLLEEEQKGGIDLTKFYVGKPPFPFLDDESPGGKAE